MNDPKQLGKGRFKELFEDGVTYCSGVKMTQFSPDEIEIHQHSELYFPHYMRDANNGIPHMEYGYIMRIIGSYGLDGEFICTEEGNGKSLASIIENAHDFTVDGIKTSPSLDSWIIRIKPKNLQWQSVKSKM